jgi:HAD superfamily hydrolase (TIGR01509 family)
MNIKLIISDLDGTLVDTYRANLNAYQKAFGAVGLELHEETYARCFGLRFDRFMQEAGIKDVAISEHIKQLKERFYPDFFSLLRPNISLLRFIHDFHRSGGCTAVASTARRTNLIKVIDSIDAAGDFDLMLSGDDVTEGKPSPEIYTRVLEHFGVSPSQALVFEDSEVGFQAAARCGVPFIKIRM